MRSKVPETVVLRALGSPVRQAILDRLSQGPSTGAELARELDSNTGVMSYHLRELAKAGLVERDKTRGRAQFWRLTSADVRFRDPRQSADPDAAQSVVDSRLGSLATSVDRYVQRDDLGSEWRDAVLFSQSALALTADELATFAAAYLELLGRWSSGRSSDPAARAVRINLFAFPDDAAASADPEPDRTDDDEQL